MAEKKATYVTMSLDSDLVNPDFRTIVCEESSDGGISNSPTTTATKCGSFTAPGTPEGTINGSGVVNTDPDVDEVSFQQLLDWANNGTKLAAIYQDSSDATTAAGAAVYMEGEGYLTDVRATSAEGDVIKFNWTFNFSGAIVTDPAGSLS